MKKFKGLAITLSLVLTASMIAGCGSNEETSTPSTTTEQGTEAPAGETAEFDLETWVSPEYGTAEESVSDLTYDGDEVVMKMGYGAAIGGKLGQSSVYFQERMLERTNGKVDVQLYPSSSLGGDREVAEAIALGNVESELAGMGTFATFYDPLQMFNAPFLFESTDQCYAFYDSDYMRNVNKDVLSATGIRVLEYSDNGKRCFSNNIRPIESPEDFVGIKMRVQENPIHLAMVEAMGGTATPISYGELYTALSQNTVDGQDNPVTNVIEMGFDEVQQYFTISNHCYDQIVFIVGDAWFTSLDKDLQQIIMEEAAVWRDYLRDLSNEMEAQNIQDLKDEGREVTELTPEQMEAFKEAVQPSWEVSEELVGSDFWNATLAEIEACK